MTIPKARAGRGCTAGRLAVSTGIVSVPADHENSVKEDVGMLRLIMTAAILCLWTLPALCAGRRLES